MKTFHKYYLPSICFVFTLSVLFSSLYNIIYNNDPTGYHGFVIQLIVYILLSSLVPFVFSHIEFKHWLIQSILCTLIQYSIFLIIAYIFKWFRFRLSNILIFTIIFIIITILAILRNDRIARQEDEWINKRIQERENFR